MLKKLVAIDEKVKFIKQVPVHPWDRSKKVFEANEKFELIKQVPLHQRERLKKKSKVTIHSRDRLKKADSKLKHPRNKMKNIEGQIGRDNVSKLMRGEFDFSPKKILNKTLIFDTSKINKEIIMNRIIDALNDKTNDEFYIEHPVGSNYFTLNWEDGR